MADDWSLSASSEDDEDAQYFQSHIREDSEYMDKFLEGDYGTDTWADHLPRFINLGLNNYNNENNSSFANVSMSNGTTMNVLHLPCSVPDRIMVLNRDTDQYEVMRFVEMSNGAVIAPEAEVNLPDSTMNGCTTASTSTSVHSLNYSLNQQINGRPIPIPKLCVHKPRVIPLEPVDLVDLIDSKADRRKRKPEPEDLMELPFPSFYHELEWKGNKWVFAKKPKPDKNQGFKLSMSYQRERSDRIHLYRPEKDPRIEKDLFSSPKRVEAQTSGGDKTRTVVGSTKNETNTKKDLFGSESDFSMPDSPARSSSMSPAFAAFNSRSNFAAERNSTALIGDGFDSGSTASDISLSDSDTFEKKIKRKSRSRSRMRKNRKDEDNEKVPPLVIKLPKTINSIDQGHSSKKQPKKKDATIVPLKLLKPPKDIIDLKNDVLAAMQGEFPDDEELTNKEERQTTEKCEQAVPTQFTESIDRIDNTAANVTGCMEMDEETVSANETIHGLDEISDTELTVEQSETRSAHHSLDAISDSEIVVEQSAMISHGNLTDLEDVSMEESVDDNPFHVDDNILDEVIKEAINTGNSEIEKNLALFDDVGSDDIDRFVEAKSNEESVATPKPTSSNNLNELIQILDPNSNEEQNVIGVDSAKSGPEHMQTERECADVLDVPEIGATADVGDTVDTQSDPINLDECSGTNSFGRPRNLLPGSDETERCKITIQLVDYELAEERLREDDFLDEHGDSVGEATGEQCPKDEEKLENTVAKNDEIQAEYDTIETSDDDQEYDHPIATESNVVPNSNTDRRVTQTNLKCTICPYEDSDGWKKLTKHYIRKHPGTEIAHSRLAERFKLDAIIASPVSSSVDNRMEIKSICLFCDQCYCLNSSKWEKHFVSHTGECPFECRVCKSKLFDDLHKRCNSQNNILINGPHEFTENKMYGYVCKLCNFVQLDKKNILKHIDSQHQAMPNEESIAEIFLINATKTASDSSDTDDIQFVEIDSDEEDNKPLIHFSVSSAKNLNVTVDAIDLTLSDDD